VKVKTVTFHLQDSDDRAPIVEQASWDISDEDLQLIHKDNPIWNYNVSPDAYESWKVALNARRNEAKLQIRSFYLKRQIADLKPPAWAYLNPMPPGVITGAHERANTVAKLCLADLQSRMMSEKRKADKFVKATAELYDEVGDLDYGKAEQRMVAMVTQARKREHELHNTKKSDVDLPNTPDDEEWAALLPRRRHTVANSRSGSKSRSNSRERAPANSPKPNNRGGANARRGRPATRGTPNRGRGRGQSNYNPNYNSNYNQAPQNDYYDNNQRGGYKGNKGNKRPNPQPRTNAAMPRDDEERFFLEGFRAGKISRRN
jgi:hypothetical protein